MKNIKSNDSICDATRQEQIVLDFIGAYRDSRPPDLDLANAAHQHGMTPEDMCRSIKFDM